MAQGPSVPRTWMLWVAVALTALAAGLVGGLLVLWVNGASTNPVINWIGDWIRTSGFAGLCAVLAAGIGFVGISFQVGASRVRDADAAWWQSFEWASDRGLPRDKSELELPSDAAIDTLNALASAARTDIQKNAVRGVIDELVRRKQYAFGDELPVTEEGKEPEPSPSEAYLTESADAEAAEDTGSDGFASAVWRYALEQVGTAAESRRAAALAYESEVLRALRHQYERVLPVRGRTRGDVIVETARRELVAEIKWSPNAIRGEYSTQRFDSVDVVISNAPAANLPPTVRLVVWNPPQGSSALRRALDTIE